MRTPATLWLWSQPTDMPCSYDGLAAKVRRHLGGNPLICVGRDYVAAARHRPLFRGRGPIGRHIIQMVSNNRSTASLGWNRAGWQPVTPALSRPRRIISTSAAA